MLGVNDSRDSSPSYSLTLRAMLNTRTMDASYPKEQVLILLDWEIEYCKKHPYYTNINNVDRICGYRIVKENT